MHKIQKCLGNATQPRLSKKNFILAPTLRWRFKELKSCLVPHPSQTKEMLFKLSQCKMVLAIQILCILQIIMCDTLPNKHFSMDLVKDCCGHTGRHLDFNIVSGLLWFSLIGYWFGIIFGYLSAVENSMARIMVYLWIFLHRLQYGVNTFVVFPHHHCCKVFIRSSRCRNYARSVIKSWWQKKSSVRASF